MKLARLLGPIGMGEVPSDYRPPLTSDAHVQRVRDWLVQRGHALSSAPEPVVGRSSTITAWEAAASNLREALNHVITILSMSRPTGVSESGWVGLQTTLDRQIYNYTEQLRQVNLRPVRLVANGQFEEPEIIPGGGTEIAPDRRTGPPAPDVGTGKGGGAGTGTGTGEGGTTPPGTGSRIWEALNPAGPFYAKPITWLGVAAGAAVVGVVMTSKKKGK